MDELFRMNRKIKNLTYILTMIAALVGAIVALLFSYGIIQVVGGVLIGALAGLIGFQMIYSLTSNIEHAGNAQASGFFGYMTRYLIYAVIFVASIFCGMNVFALLAGFTCHKIAIMYYGITTREEDD